MSLRKLSRDEWEELDTQYQRTSSLGDSVSASGEHYILVALLNRLGFFPHSREEAMQIAEELLSNGWDD